MTEKIRRKRLRMSDQLFTEESTDSEEDDPENQFDPERRFPLNIRVVKGDHLNPKSPGSQQYTVWCSDGYDGDKWHGYDGPPDKEFDSIWETKDEANMRAEYLFYWKNCWGIPGDEMMDGATEVKQMEQEGLKKFTTCPADSSRWTVGVVPSVAYPWLDNASLERHGYDKEEEAEKKQGYSNWRYYIA